jgi:hypothetical protein
MLTALILAAGLLPACSKSGSPSLSDTQHWRVKFSKGDAYAIDTVASKGAAAVPLLTKLISDTNGNIVQNAAMAAQQIGPPAAGVLPALIGALERFPDNPFVTQAIKAMKDSAVPYLVPLVESANEADQSKGVKLLNGIGEAAAPAIEPLMAIIEGDASLTLKKDACVTIGSIGRPAESVLDRLKVVAESNADLHRAAAMAHKRIRTARKVIAKGGDR